MLAGPKRSVGSVARLVIIISLLFPAYPVSLTYGLVFQPSLYLLSLAHLFEPKRQSDNIFQFTNTRPLESGGTPPQGSGCWVALSS